MRTIPLAALALSLGMPLLAEEAAPTEGVIDARFTWSSVDLATAPAAGDGTAMLLEARLVVESNVGGPIDQLAGTCLMKGVMQGQDWRSTGSCALKDADGDLLFEEVEETGDKGHGVFTGGTGKFAGISGEHDITTTWFASIRDGENQGVGTKTGHWRREAM